MNTRKSHLNNKQFLRPISQENTHAETKQCGKNFCRPSEFAFPLFVCVCVCVCVPSLDMVRRNSVHYNRIMESLFLLWWAIFIQAQEEEEEEEGGGGDNEIQSKYKDDVVREDK